MYEVFDGRLYITCWIYLSVTDTLKFILHTKTAEHNV